MQAGEVVGILVTHSLGPDDVFVDYVCTGKAFRRRGIARRLINSVSHTTWLLVESFSPAFRAYLSIGFEIVPSVPVYESGAWQTCMRRKSDASSRPMDAESKERMAASTWRRIVEFMKREHPKFKDSQLLHMLRSDDAGVRYRCVYREEVEGGCANV